jgi:hypothetical protein
MANARLVRISEVLSLKYNSILFTFCIFEATTNIKVMKQTFASFETITNSHLQTLSYNFSFSQVKIVIFFLGEITCVCVCLWDTVCARDRGPHKVKNVALQTQKHISKHECLPNNACWALILCSCLNFWVINHSVKAKEATKIIGSIFLHTRVTNSGTHGSKTRKRGRGRKSKN